MSAAHELDVLLNRLIDGTLDVETTSQLQSTLTVSAPARRRYRQILAMHAGLQWDYVAAVREQVSPNSRTSRLRWLPVIMALAASLLVVVGLWIYQSTRPLATLTVASINGGNFSWNNGTTDRRSLTEKEVLTAGRFILEGDSATAVLRFDDGSVLPLTGDTELTTINEDAKKIQLTRGIISADVQPQHAGYPFIVRTATAELQVIGTRFMVAATDTGTALDVHHGRVRMQRLADGQAIEVAAQQSATATLDVAQALQSSDRQRPPTHINLTFNQAPPSHWGGTWISPTGDKSGFIRAVPYVAGRTDKDAPIIHHGIYIRDQDAFSRPFVRFLEDSQLTMRFRVARPDGKAKVLLLICTHTASGAFGGTFNVVLNAADYSADAAGWRTVRLPIAELSPSRPMINPSIADRDAIFILPHTVSAQVGLEVASLTVSAP